MSDVLKFFAIMGSVFGIFYIVASLVAKYNWEDYCVNKGYSEYECLLAESNDILQSRIILNDKKPTKKAGSK